MVARASKTTLKGKLDRLVGGYCRSLGACQAHGYREDNKNPPRPCTSQLQWCHIKSRRYLSVRWSENNYLCLCAGHHLWFTSNPEKFTYFLLDWFPEQLERLDEEFKEVHPMRAMDMEDLFNSLKEEYEN